MKEKEIPFIPPEGLPIYGMNPLSTNPLGMAPLGFMALGLDPLGSYTGVTEDVLEEPVQDADDL